MSSKNARIAELIAGCEGQGLDARYVCYFACFNRGLYFEAHEVLESLWLAERKSPNYSFFKGMIQLAGAFVHLQKNRPGPAASLFKLARANLRNYPATHERLDVAAIRSLIESWLEKLEAGRFDAGSLSDAHAPKIHLLPATPV